MKQRIATKPNHSSILLLAGGIAFTALLNTPLVKAESLPLTDTVRCIPDATHGTVSKNTFSISRGKEIIFECTIIRSENGGPLSATLMAKQNGGGQSTVISLADIVTTDSLPVKASLRFPAVFQQSDYLYSFSLINTETKQPLSREVTLLGTLKDSVQSRITKVSTDKSDYTWGDTVTLKLSLDTVEGSASPLSLDLSMPTADGAVCAKLLENQSITGDEMTLTTVIPKKDDGCTNTLNIALKAEDGKTVLDQKTLALNITTPETTNEQSHIASRGSFASLIGLVVAFGVVILSLVGFLFLKKKR